MKLLPLAGLLMGLAGIGYGVFQWADQRWLVEHGQPVSAVILSSEVKSHHNGHITEYSPEVRYQFKVAGRLYESNEVFAASDEGSQSWAEDVAARFPPGSAQTAYHDPRDPQKAFLIRRYNASPYVTLGFGLIMFAFGPFLFLHLRAKDAPHLPRENTERWFVLTPAWNLRRAGPVLTIGGIVYVVIGILLFTDLYRRVEPPYGGLTIAYTIFYWLVALLMLGSGGYVLISGRDVGEPVLALDRPTICGGDSVRLRFEQTFWRGMTIRDVSVTLSSYEEKFHFHGQGGTTIEEAKYKVTHEFLQGRAVSQGETLRHEEILDFPAHLPPSTRWRWWTSPRHFWRIDVKVRVVGRLKYKCQYYVRVEPALILRPAGVID